MTVPQLPNDRWSIDFVADQFMDDGRLRISAHPGITTRQTPIPIDKKRGQRQPQPSLSVRTASLARKEAGTMRKGYNAQASDERTEWRWLPQERLMRLLARRCRWYCGRNL
jgi:hypothetical protein